MPRFVGKQFWMGPGFRPESVIVSDVDGACCCLFKLKVFLPPASFILCRESSKQFPMPPPIYLSTLHYHLAQQLIAASRTQLTV